MQFTADARQLFMHGLGLLHGDTLLRLPAGSEQNHYGH